ncbi:hypothetical protein ACIL2W_004489 [Vibrio parahaemolyticus]|nr:hypothetical protein [Vibrio parahaemolyticus]HCM1507452.1 hypothetical protein [Vibrio parahaemolyticus]
MFSKLDGFQKKLLAFSVLCGVVIYPASILYNYTFFTIPALFAAFLLPFFIIVDYQDSRIQKGLLLIIFGAGFHYFFMGGVQIVVIPSELTMQHKIIGDIAIFATAGAGGGLIANHADQATDENRELKSNLNTKLSHNDFSALDARLYSLERKLGLIRDRIIIGQSVVIVLLMATIGWLVI